MKFQDFINSKKNSFRGNYMRKYGKFIKKFVIFFLISAAVVLAFFLCWAPFHAQRLGYVYFKDSILFRTLNEYLFHVSGFFYYLSATVNPILYNLMSLKYRHAFRQTLCSKNRRGLGRGGGSNAYGISGRRGTDELDTGQPLRSYTFRSSSRSGKNWFLFYQNCSDLLV